MGYEPLHDLRERSRREGTAEFRDRLSAAGLSEDLADRPAMGPAVLVSVSRTGAFVAGEKFPFELGKPRIPLEIPRNYVLAKTAGGDYQSLAEVWPTRRTADDFAAGVLWQVHGMETPEFWVETAPGRFASKQSYDRMRGDPTQARRLPENPRLLICRPDGDGPEIPFRVKQIAERHDPYDFRRIMGRAGMPESLGNEPYEVPPVLVLTPDGDLRAGDTFPHIPGGQRIPDDIESGRIFVQGVFADGEPTGTYSGISRDSRMPRLAHWIHPDALRQAGIEERDPSPKPAMRSPGPGRPAATEGTVIDLTKDDPPGPESRGRGGRPMRAFSGALTAKLDPDGDTIMRDAFPAPREPVERRLPADHRSRTVIDLTGGLPDMSGETPTFVRGIKRGRETTAEPPGRGLDKRLRGNSREIT